MDVNKKVVNGIPSAYYFKYKLGRTGVYGTLKRSDPSIDDIYNALKRAELYRFFLSKDAIARLRDVRKKCNALLNVVHLFKDPYSKRERTIIKELKANLDRRIDAVATHFLGVHKEQALENYENRLEFEAFYDKANLNGKAVGRTLDNAYRYERANSRHLGKETVKNWLDSGSQLTLNTWMDTVRQWAGEDGDSTLAELAQEAGFYDQSHFARDTRELARNADEVAVRAAQEGADARGEFIDLDRLDDIVVRTCIEAGSGALVSVQAPGARRHNHRTRRPSAPGAQRWTHWLDGLEVGQVVIGAPGNHPVAAAMTPDSASGNSTSKGERPAALAMRRAASSVFRPRFSTQIHRCSPSPLNGMSSTSSTWKSSAMAFRTAVPSGSP